MAENSTVRILKLYVQKLKSFFLSKDILSFLLFLIVSATFWFVNALGKERETTIEVPIRYIGIPQNVAITNTPPSVLNLSVRDQGTNLFAYSRGKITPITINLERVFYQKGEILITADELSGRVNRYMHMQPTSTVLQIKPDSILIQYEKLSVKTVPIKFNSKIELARQYILSNKILIEPSQVTVFGPKTVLDTLSFVATEFTELKNLKDTSVLNCKLKALKSARYSSDNVKVSVFVELFTEKKVQIPITSINCPQHLSIRTFPAVVNAVYTVGLSNFNTFASNDIQVYLDYKELKKNKLSKQKLIVKTNSPNISNLRIFPQEVEFILEAK